MYKKNAILGLMIALTGCASHPEDLQTQYVSSTQYKDYDCDQIGLEMTRISSRVTNLETSLTEKADGDTAQMAVGMLLLWPTLFFLEGGDGPEAQEYTRLKGEFEALQQMNTVKKCSLPQSTQVAQAFATPSPAQVAAATALVSPTVPNPVVIPVATTLLLPAPAAPPVTSQAIVPQAAYVPPAVVQPIALPAAVVPAGAPPVRSRATVISTALSQQILPCWVAPASTAGQVIGSVGIHLHLLPDGTVQSAEPVDANRVQTEPAYRALAEGAQQAAFKCSPLNLPRDEYDAWSDIIMNFKQLGASTT